jgi:serine/threonine protein kinase/Flp pilus assembly protein TadD
MGTVFMAEQTRPVKRLVALKLIKTSLDSRQVLGRFEAERQALALMEHPNIAKVLDAGATEQGRPYFVMELVRGVPITRFCDDGRLSPRERLELLLPVCRAVQHAHQKGIIHRDLKPSNVLVGLYDPGAPGVPKIIDFGVAKATGPRLTEATLCTGFGAVVGTPEYMSPEQAQFDNLDVDTRSDVYSPGVLLYELLTGTTPLDRRRLGQTPLLEVLRVIREEDPPRPSTWLSTTAELPAVAACRNVEPRKLSGLVRGELDWIVMKALEKDRARRYETAEGLAADLRRYLDDEPVLACPPSAGYRLRKFARRNKASLASAATIALALLVAVVALGFSNRRIQAEQQRADEQKGRAEANLRKAREVVDRMFTRVAKDLEHTPRMEKIRRALLEDALEFYQGFLKEKGSDPALRYETARAYMRVANIQAVLGRFSQAVEPWGRATALLEKLTAEFARVADYWRDLAECHRERGYAYSQINKTEMAYEDGRAEFRIHEKLTAEFPNVPDIRRELARTYTEFGLSLEERSAGEAEVLHRKAVDVWDRLRKDFPELPGDLYGTARGHHWLGSLLTSTGRLPEAEQELRQALPLAERALAVHSENTDFRAEVAQINRYIGHVLTQEGREAEAENRYRRSRRLYESLMEDFPDTPEYRNDWCGVSGDLGESLREMGRLQEAEECLQRAIELAARHDPTESRRGGGLYARLGLVYHESGRDHDAADAFRRARVRYEREDAASDKFSQKIAYARFLTHCPATQFRNPERAVALAKHALQWAPQSRRGWQVLGAAEYRSGHWEAAIEAMLNAMKFGSKDDPAVMLYLAMANWRLGRKSEARRWYDQAVGWMDQKKSRDGDQRRLRAEAAALLGLPEPKAPARKEVPHPPRG